MFAVAGFINHSYKSWDIDLQQPVSIIISLKCNKSGFLFLNTKQNFTKFCFYYSFLLLEKFWQLGHYICSLHFSLVVDYGVCWSNIVKLQA